MNKYTIRYTDMASENWSCWVTAGVIPMTGETVTLPDGSSGRVFLTEHIYVKDKDELVVLDHLDIYLNWSE